MEVICTSVVSELRQSPFVSHCQKIINVPPIEMLNDTSQ